MDGVAETNEDSSTEKATMKERKIDTRERRVKVALFEECSC